MSDQSINYYRIEQAIGYLTERFKEQPDLDEIARKVHMSPFHFQRMFTDWVGISPKKFLQYLTLDYLKTQIKHTGNMVEAADLVGLSSQSRVHDLFVNIEGMSPQQYKTAGKDLEIFYGYHASPFGLCFIAVAEKGVCALKFIDEEKSRDEYERFARQWPHAQLMHKPTYTQVYIKNIFQPMESNESLSLLVRGTAFQIKVWEALVNIPFGSLTSFQQVADKIGHPGSARAVGSAVGANTILYLIPCHRVISGDGTMGHYHYGKVRKMAMIGWESALINA
jgi:AraC family transcriptional regulator, regulatory protein of adaptative response / methylated-DNA-[protein]-cysteine methyltransferase